MLPFILNCQYSNYYNVDVNSNSRVSGNINVNKNVNVSGYTTQTIKTIDYGALANANAIRERNRIEQQRITIEQAKYNDGKERQKEILESKKALEIAENPTKAHEYGQFHSHSYDYLNKGWKGLLAFGYKSFTDNLVIPHKSLFQNIGQGRWENISTDGINTEIRSIYPYHNFKQIPYLSSDEMKNYKKKRERLLDYYKSHNKPIKKNYKKNKDKFKNDLLRYIEICDSLDNYLARGDLKSLLSTNKYKEGQKFAPTNQLSDSGIYHKTEVVKRIVYGNQGFRSTIIWEDEFEICITDNYVAFNNNVEYRVKVRYKADKESDVSFQDLEGRRYYLSKFIDKHVASRYLNKEIKVESLDPYFPKRKKYNSKAEFEEALNLYSK